VGLGLRDAVRRSDDMAEAWRLGVARMTETVLVGLLREDAGLRAQGILAALRAPLAEVVSASPVTLRVAPDDLMELTRLLAPVGGGEGGTVPALIADPALVPGQAVAALGTGWVEVDLDRWAAMVGDALRAGAAEAEMPGRAAMAALGDADGSEAGGER